MATPDEVPELEEKEKFPPKIATSLASELLDQNSPAKTVGEAVVGVDKVDGWVVVCLWNKREILM
jgi:hypothetical protein